MNRFKFYSLMGVLSLTLASVAVAQNDAPPDPARDREMRDRYEKVLLKNPFQERAFNSVYEGWSKVEGVDKWIDALKPKAESGEDALAALLLLGQVYDRQFKTAEAIAAFEQASAKGEARPQFSVLLGTLYYKAGRDDQAAQRLSTALDALTDLDQRSSVCRMLGNLYLRQGKRDQAIAVWKRIAEQNPEEIFAQLELAEIYEDNRLWDQAIGVHRQVAEKSKDDPYRRCRALRSIGQCLVQAEKFKDAIATFEEALGLVSPGNWLFEDIKLKLVGVYEDIGDLAGLAKYAEARLAQNAGDVEFRDLLAETLTRMAKFDDAEKQYRTILERNPRNSAVYEKLLALHTRNGKKAEAVAAFEKLIELFPTDTDYLRRLGEFHLRNNQPEQAKETWRRVAKDNPTGEKLAMLAGWFESYEFPDDAITTYQQALEKTKNKDWSLRLAALKFQKGEEAEALKLWLAAIDPATSKPEDYAEVASILESNQKLDEALKLRKTAVEKDGTNLEGRLAYAKLLLRLQKFEPALAEFEILAAQEKNEYLTQQGESGRIDAWRELGVLADKQKAMEKDLDANPTDAKKLGQLARLFERGGQRDKAIALYEARLEKEPGNPEHLRALATLYKNGKLTDQAIATFKTLLEKDKNRARVYQKELLDVYLSIDSKDDAIAAAEAYVSFAPGDPEAHLTLAQVYQLYRLPEKGFGEYRTALRLEANQPDYHRQFGEALEQEKRFGEAQEAFRKMLDVAKEDSTRLGAVANLARIHLAQDQLDPLVSEFQRRIRNTPKKLAAYEELAAVYKEAGQITKSVEVLESGLQAVDDRSAALKALIRMAFEAQDFPKVRSSFEQLIALSGKPSAQEYERLGQIYAQTGEVEKAKETWNKILTAAPKDAKAADKVSSLLGGEGFSDEALAVKARAIELDPTDFKRRFDYAQLLAQNQQFVPAMEQVRQILELGDREEKKDEKESEKKVQRVNRGPQGPGAVSPYQFMYGGGGYYGGYWGGGWQGSFKQFKPQLLQFMANLARQSVGEEAFLEQFSERAKKAKDSLEVKRDLLQVLQMFNRVDESVKLAEEILAASPNDPDLLMQTALHYSNAQQIDKSIALLERLAKAQPKQRLLAVQGLVPLYFKNKQEDKGLELIDQMLKENANDVQIFFAMGYVLQNSGKWDQARRVFERVKDIDPNMADNVRLTLANLAKQSGKADDANALFKEILLNESTANRGFFVSRKRVDIYVPDAMPNQNRAFYGGPAMQNLPQNAIAQLPWERVNAFTELKTSAKSNPALTNIFVELEKIARSYSLSSTPSARDRAWETARLLVAHYITEKQFEQAAELLGAVRKAGMDDPAWFNAAIFVAHQREDFAGMLKLYDELQQRVPAKARDIAMARTATHLIAKKYEDAAKSIRDLSQQRVPPAQVIGLINAVMAAGEKKIAKQLLEEHLAGGLSRNSQALAMLAQLWGEENEYDKAIALASEAWERKAHGRQTGNYYYGSYYGMMYYGGIGGMGSPDGLLAELHRYHVGAGKSEELIAKFKERLDKQPSSTQAHEDLAALYRMSDQRDKAIEIYESLLQKRPHLFSAVQSMAQIYQESGQIDKATKLYEDLMKTNPMYYTQFQWQLRYLYQRMGKGKELEKMENKIVEKARDPNQLANLAWRMRESGDWDKAAELLRKAMKLAPGQSYYQSQLATVLIQKGDLDEAVKLYQEWLDSPMIRAQGWVDHNSLKQLAGLYRATGKLGELKTRCEADLKKNSTDQIARALQTQIAILEKRFDDALAGMKSAVETATDPNIVNELTNFAEMTGRVSEILEIAEKADQRSNPWEAQQLARLYFAKGDKKKAEEQQIKWAENMIQQGNAGWATRETIQSLSQMQLWDAAENFVRKHRSDAMNEWEAQEMDRVVAEQYAQNNRFKSIVDEVLKKDSFKGRDLDLLRRVNEAYRNNNLPAKQQVFLEKLVTADPRNRELAFELAQRYNSADELPLKLALLKRLTEEDTSNPQYRESYADALVLNGQADEAIGNLAKWASEKPLEARYSMLSRIQSRAGRFAEARASLVKAAEQADKSRQPELKISLAEFDSAHGDLAALREVLRANFETKKDANAFSRYFQFLNVHGFADDAHALFVTNKDNGFLDQYRGQDFLNLCLNRSDYQTPLDLTWQFTRYGERYNRDFFSDQVRRAFQQRGKLAVFVEDFRRRADAEGTNGFGMLDHVAKNFERGGWPEKALEIYDRLVARSPFNREAVQAKAKLLIKLKRGDEALALLRDPKGIDSLESELNAALEVIRACLELDKLADADAEATRLLAWSKSGSMFEQLAGAYFEKKHYAKAAEYYEQARKTTRTWNYENLLANLSRCQAKLGRANELAQTWAELTNYSNENFINTLVSWFASEGMSELVIQFAEARLAQVPDNLEFYFSLAQAHQKAGRIAEAFAAFERAAKAIGGERQQDLRSRVADFLFEHKLVNEALTRHAAQPTPTLTAALVLALARAEENSDHAKSLLNAAGQFKLDDARLQIDLGGALQRHKRNSDAAEWYRRALTSTNRDVRFAAARGLAVTTGDKQAIAILAERLKTMPQEFGGYEPFIADIVKTGDAALIEQLSGALAESSLHDTEKEFRAALLQWHRGQTNEARVRFAALADAPKLVMTQLQTLARLFEESNAVAERAKVLQRLAGGGFGADASTRAWVDLMRLHTKACDWKQAIAALARTHAVWGIDFAESPRFELADTVKSDNYAAFRAAIVDAAAARPNDDVASSLIGLCQQLAQRLGREDTAAHLADEAKLGPLERDEAIAWDSLIENWEIAGPYSGADQSALFPPEQEQAAKPGDALPKAEIIWKKTDPKRELGVIRLAPILGLKVSESAGKCAYARTTIDSPEDRRATFLIGSDDWLRVWVNGELVHTSSEPRSCYLDQDRVTVNLKKGANRILLKVGNLGDAWNFCFRIAEGSQGLSLSRN